jgi:hypothetical protein
MGHRVLAELVVDRIDGLCEGSLLVFVWLLKERHLVLAL